MASEMIPIYYDGFWDVPMAFLTILDEKIYLFDRGGFDEELDDYPPNYKIFLVKDVSLEDAFEPRDASVTMAVKISSYVLHGEHEFIGEVEVDGVCFDETRRKFFDSRILKVLLR